MRDEEAVGRLARDWISEEGPEYHHALGVESSFDAGKGRYVSRDALVRELADGYVWLHSISLRHGH